MRPSSASANPPKGQVVHVTTSLDFGGVETHMEILGSLRAQAAYAPVFCAIAGGGNVSGVLERSGARVVCLQASPRIPSPVAIWRLWRLFRRLRPAVVHTHGAEANFHGLLAAALAGVRVRIGEEIGIPDHGPAARLAFRTCYRFAHKVIGVSGCVTEWLVRSDEVPAGKAATLTVPVRLPETSAAPRPPEDRFRLAFVGRLEPVKNLGQLMTAFAALRESGADAELWLLGNGSLAPELEAQAARLRLSDRVRFLGYRSDPGEWLRQCHVCVQPSLSEGFGLAMVEAMGCQVPVVSTRVGVAPDIITDGANGWLLEGFGADAIQEGLQRAYRCRDRIPAIGRASRETVLPLFDSARYLERLEDLYTECGG